MAEEANWWLAYVNSAFELEIKAPLKIDNMSTDASENNIMSVKPYGYCITVIRVTNTAATRKITPKTEILRCFRFRMNTPPTNANPAQIMSITPKNRNPKRSEIRMGPKYSGELIRSSNDWCWYTPIYPMPAINTAEIIVNTAATGTKSVCFCDIIMEFCSGSSSDVRDFPHLGQIVASSSTSSLSQYGQFN